MVIGLTRKRAFRPVIISMAIMKTGVSVSHKEGINSVIIGKSGNIVGRNGNYWQVIVTVGIVR